ncbi:MAG TPA: hypothetical protein DCW95_07455 [Chryseobacterium sp.]|nr:hypothetical protein [Chryseobacterium sp.]
MNTGCNSPSTPYKKRPKRVAFHHIILTKNYCALRLYSSMR